MLIEPIAGWLNLDISVLNSYSMLGSLLTRWVDAGLAFLLSFMILKFFKFVVIKRLEALSKKTKTEIDDLFIAILDSVKWPFFVLISIYLGMKFLELPAKVGGSADFIMLLIVLYYFIKAINRVVDFLGKIYSEANKDKDTSIIHFLQGFVKILVWLAAILLVLSNLGYNVSTLLAGLGIGGIAIALALQNILGDLFASISIYFDKPFKVGDFIIIGTEMGTVKRVGIKTTRIESLSGEEIVISNTELINSRVRNYKKMKKRRIAYTFGVTYQTSNNKLKRILEIVKANFKRVDGADLDRVHFKTFGPSSLDFEVIFYVNTSDYTKYMDIQQDLNFGLKAAFEKEKIDFAYPTQTIFLEK
ncbi:mechanosensitive ion channel family protein [Candidatus Woesearchaeota archaeon]|nr:mechanosensitive ion channel family protein [Candidatus Woesearchaeota archaeon]